MVSCCKLDSTLCIETSKELRTRQAEAVYEERADQSLTKQLVTCNMDTEYPPIRNISITNLTSAVERGGLQDLMRCPAT
jgi:hypothetical protein